MSTISEDPTRTTWHAVVADDDDDTRSLIASALRRAGFDVRESSNGEELVDAFAALASSRTLVVSDVGMPICGGIEALIALKKLAPSAPVLMITAFGDRSTLRSARSAGADEIMQKPIDLEALVRTALALTRRGHA